jgi:hypothetical protein
MRTILFALFLTVPSFGEMLGTTVTFNYEFFGLLAGPSTAVVGPGVEFTCPNVAVAACQFLTSNSQTLDFGDDSVEYRANLSFGSSFSPGATFNGFRLSGLDLVAGSVFTTNIAGLDLSRVTITVNTVDVNMENLAITGGSFWRVASAVPEPSTWAFLGAGLAGLILRRRRRQALR